MPIAFWFSLDTTEKRLSRGEGSSPLQCSQEVVTLLCHKSTVMPNGQLGDFATKLLASRSDPACIKSCCGLIIKSFLASGPYIYLFLNFVRFLFVHFPGCQGPSKWHNLLLYQLLLTLSYCLQHNFGFSATDFQKKVIKLWWNYRKWRISLWKLKNFVANRKQGELCGITTELNWWPFTGNHMKQTQIPLLFYQQRYYDLWTQPLKADKKKLKIQ